MIFQPQPGIHHVELRQRIRLMPQSSASYFLQPDAANIGIIIKIHDRRQFIDKIPPSQQSSDIRFRRG